MFGRKRLQQENEAMRKALAWYADESNWKRHTVSPKGAPTQWVKSKASHDRGDRARWLLMRLLGLDHTAPRTATVPPPLASRKSPTT